MNLIPPQRDRFDIPESVTYLNCAYYSPSPNVVRDALAEGAAHKSRPWLITPIQFFDEVEQLRLLLAEVLGGRSEGYAIVPSATYGVTTAARAVEPLLAPGDEILILAEEFPSLYLPLEQVARQTGAKIVIAPIDGPSLTDALLGRMGGRTRVVATCPCHWTNGRPINLHRISEAAKTAGAVLIVDATQSLGAVPFDFDGIDADFVAAAGYKWLLCPYGFGVLHVAERWWHARPLEESWLARDRAEDFAKLADYSLAYKAGARRFDVSETCCATVTRGAIAALELLKEWQVEAIGTTLRNATRQIAGLASHAGLVVPPEDERMPHMFGVSVPDGRSDELVHRFGSNGVVVSRRGRSIRFSPHLHVTETDFARVARALE